MYIGKRLKKYRSRASTSLCLPGMSPFWQLLVGQFPETSSFSCKTDVLDNVYTPDASPPQICQVWPGNKAK